MERKPYGRIHVQEPITVSFVLYMSLQGTLELKYPKTDEKQSLNIPVDCPRHTSSCEVLHLWNIENGGAHHRSCKGDVSEEVRKGC